MTDHPRRRRIEGLGTHRYRASGDDTPVFLGETGALKCSGGRMSGTWGSFVLSLNTRDLGARFRRPPDTNVTGTCPSLLSGHGLRSHSRARPLPETEVRPRTHPRAVGVTTVATCQCLHRYVGVLVVRGRGCWRRRTQVVSFLSDRAGLPGRVWRGVRQGSTCIHVYT